MKIQLLHDGFALVPDSYGDKLMLRRMENRKYPAKPRQKSFTVKKIVFMVVSFSGGYYTYHTNTGKLTGELKVH